jgi:mRNA interferase YafQ
MLTIRYSKKFQKNLELMIRRGKDPEKIKVIIACLAEGSPLEVKYRDHPLVGNFAGFRDCHIEPDWLLIYRINADFLYLERTGTHSDIFKR